MSSMFPETRHSLILRLPDASDIEAWDEFVAVYQPLLFRLVRSRGLQDADAQEVVQEVMLAVSRAAERWEPDPARGRFRDWLFRIARNLTINWLTRKKHRPLGTGDTQMSIRLDDLTAPSLQHDEFELEYRREIFRRATERVRQKVTARTWEAFWLTSIGGRTIPQAAKELGMSVGAIHVARSRVLGRLRDVVERFEDSTALPAVTTGAIK